MRHHRHVRFDHNDHYHPLLLSLVPAGARRALDVGCGTGRFARALAARGLSVDALDADKEVIEAASAAPGVRYAVADVTRKTPPPGTYDFISCIASLHHMPFDTVAGLRDALRPGGVLAVLGLYRGGPADVAKAPLVVPLNLGIRAALSRRPDADGEPVRPRVRDPEMTLPEIRERAAELLPGAVISPRLFWRYVLAYRHPAPACPRP